MITHSDSQSSSTRRAPWPLLTHFGLIALCSLLTACDYEHPAGEPDGVALDSRLLGTWEMVPSKPDQKPDKFEIKHLYVDRFSANFMATDFEFFHAGLGVRNAVQVRIVDGFFYLAEKLPKNLVLVYQLSPDRKTLTVQRLNKPKEVALGSAAETRRFISATLEQPQYLATTYTFRRSQAGTAQSPQPAAPTPAPPTTEEAGQAALDFFARQRVRSQQP